MLTNKVGRKQAAARASEAKHPLVESYRFYFNPAGPLPKAYSQMNGHTNLHLGTPRTSVAGVRQGGGHKFHRNNSLAFAPFIT